MRRLVVSILITTVAALGSGAFAALDEWSDQYDIQISPISTDGDDPAQPIPPTGPDYRCWLQSKLALPLLSLEPLTGAVIPSIRFLSYAPVAAHDLGSLRLPARRDCRGPPSN